MKKLVVMILIKHKLFTIKDLSKLEINQFEIYNPHINDSFFCFHPN
jgi:hypothetical protein